MADVVYMEVERDKLVSLLRCEGCSHVRLFDFLVDSGYEVRASTEVHWTKGLDSTWSPVARAIFVDAEKTINEVA